MQGGEMKTIFFTLMFALVCSSAFALTWGFRGYSTSGEAQTQLPAYCDIIAASNIHQSGMIEGPVSITRIVFDSWTTARSFTPSTYDYKIKCTLTSTGAAAVVKMFFDTETSAYFPISTEMFRFR
jgi:hypothetical protein